MNEERDAPPGRFGSGPPDWPRIFPDADHRWTMGLRSGDAAAFFAPRDLAGTVLPERARWLAEAPERYVALLPVAIPALHETIALANSLGTAVVDSDAASNEESLARLGRAWEPDFVWMHADAGGPHRLVGGVVCFPSAWALSEKVGLTMHDVHEPVPGLNALLGRQIETFLTKLEPGAVWTRENASFVRDANLNHHPDRWRRRPDATIAEHEFHVRLEHQLLMKLPASGSVLFGIRLEIVPVATIKQDRTATARLRRLLATMSSDAVAYKSLATARDAMLAILDG